MMMMMMMVMLTTMMMTMMIVDLSMYSSILAQVVLITGVKHGGGEAKVCTERRGGEAKVCYIIVR